MNSKAPISRHEPEPKTWQQATASPNADKWRSAGEDKVLRLNTMHAWEAVDPIPAVKPINSDWVFKTKYAPNGEVVKYNGHLVNGFGMFM